MTNLLILKNITKEHKNLTNTEEHVSQKDNKNVTDDGYDSEITKQQIRKTKTKGFNSDNVISNNSEKLKNENGRICLSVRHIFTLLLLILSVLRIVLIKHVKPTMNLTDITTIPVRSNKPVYLVK
jgi:hypothetical protein